MAPSCLKFNDLFMLISLQQGLASAILLSYDVEGLLSGDIFSSGGWMWHIALNGVRLVNSSDHSDGIG